MSKRGSRNVARRATAAAIGCLFAAANAWSATEQEAAQLGRELDALATASGALPGVTIRRSFHRPAKPLTPGTQTLADLARAAAEDLGQKLPFGTTGGVCDGNNLQAEGLPTIDTLGVRGGGLHTISEWIEMPSLVERCQLTAVLIARLSAGAMPPPNC